MGSQTVHQVARAGFGRSAAAYERGRPGYAADAIAWLTDTLAISSQTTVLDLGAGTGKLTRLLEPTGCALIAVEPLDEMRSELVRAVPRAVVLAGTAEAIPLGDGSADIVVAGQAFHWFAVGRAAAEIHRVLRADAGLGLIWNVRDPSAEIHVRLERILARYRGEAPRAYTWGGDPASWQLPLETSGRFAAGGAFRAPHVQEVDHAGLVDRVASVSFIGALPPEERDRVLEEVRELAAALPPVVRLPYLTTAYVYRAV